jgi:carboxypeptidase family protein
MTRRARQRTAVRAVAWATAGLLLFAGRGEAQNHTIAGVVRDSATGAPVAGAVIGAASPLFSRVTRSNERGQYAIGGVPDGIVTIGVRQLGYAAWSRQVRLTGRDTTIDVALHAAASALDTVRVRANVTGIRGLVGTARDLRPIVGAKAQVIGAEHDAVTDSSGAFFVELRKPGTYVLRVSHAGYSPQVLSVDVPKNRTIETSALLDSGNTEAKDAEGLWQDFVSRVRMRGPNSAVVAGSALRDAGGSVVDALRGSPAFTQHGMRIGPTTCVFINGRPSPGLPLDGVDIRQIETIELYGAGADATGTLARSWPPGLPCGTNVGVNRVVGAGSRTVTAQTAVIWLRR